MNKKSIVAIYAVAVCFISVASAIVCATTAIYNVVEITNPKFTMSSYDYNPHQNNESFLEYKLKSYPKDYDNPYRAMSEDKLTAARERSFQMMLDHERRSGQQSLLRCLIVIMVLALTFWGHWTIARKATGGGAAAE